MKRWKTWETAALLALCTALLTATWAQGRENDLSSKLIRLHVLAASDSSEDQEAKLRARDAVLELLTPALREAKDAEEAAGIICRLRPELTRAAAEASGTRAEVCLSRENYPTRSYESFRLPAGEYASLRVILGEGEGHNWWCVAYPPLCMQAVTEESWGTAALDEEDVRLVTEDGEGYVIRFRLMELWGRLSAALRGREVAPGD